LTATGHDTGILTGKGRTGKLHGPGQSQSFTGHDIGNQTAAHASGRSDDNYSIHNTKTFLQKLKMCFSI
jgi:hypothetical protein